MMFVVCCQRRSQLLRAPTLVVIIKQAAIRRLLALLLLAAALSLGGCFGVGMAARKAFADKDKEGASIVAAQEQAITAANGGAPGVPIAWSDKKTGVRGTLQRVSPDTAGGCRQYNQVLKVGTETAHGTVRACPHADGTWHLQDERTNIVSG
jgi:surface antigen